jgi:hypothetical protein
MFTLVNGVDLVPWLLMGIRMIVLVIPDTEDLPSCLERLELQEMQSKISLESLTMHMLACIMRERI